MAVVKRSGRWQASYRGPDGRERTKTFDLRSDADRWVRDQRTALDTGTWIDPSSAKVTFGEFVETWKASQVWRDGTRALVDMHFKNHVLPTWEHRPIGSIRPSEAQAWVKGLSTKLAPSTIEVVVSYVGQAFRAAIDDRLIATSPLTRVKLPKREHHDIVILTAAQVAAMAARIDERYRAVIVLAAGTGMRQGELLGLTIDRVDWLRKTVRIDRQLSSVKGHTPVLAPPKTARSVRTIPVGDVVIEALSAHLAAFPAGIEGLIFTGKRGDPIRRSTWGLAWDAPARAIGLPKGVGIHCLRHTHASFLISAGCSVKVVQERLGHATAAETLDTYSHLWPDDDDRSRQAVDNVLAPILGRGSRGQAADKAVDC
jgi:integrase